MEKIMLSKREKEALRLVAGGCNLPRSYPLHVFAASVGSLERMGLAVGAWAEGHVLEAARLTDMGREYLALNPRLRNPVDWKRIAEIAVAAVAAAATVLGLFVACSLLR